MCVVTACFDGVAGILTKTFQQGELLHALQRHGPAARHPRAGCQQPSSCGAPAEQQVAAASSAAVSSSARPSAFVRLQYECVTRHAALGGMRACWAPVCQGSLMSGVVKVLVVGFAGWNGRLLRGAKAAARRVAGGACRG